ncbi:hypothetical protein ABMA27_011848 [Loxostege sticticalis]|uniref:Regulatory protein zeste n=1 Tax=Loxostege sticticalis TaxID=481309 RepID=A0ABR3IHR5_LOXSC
MASRSRRVTEQQLELLWEFLNSHRDLAVAYNRTLRAKYYSKCKWEELASTLNAQGNGAFKNWKGWSKYWVDYKAKLKKRVVAVRASRNRTGGGPATEPPLSLLEIKFIGLMGGNSFAEGLPGVRVEPILPPRTATPQEENTRRISRAGKIIILNYHQLLNEHNIIHSFIARIRCINGGLNALWLSLPDRRECHKTLSPPCISSANDRRGRGPSAPSPGDAGSD